MLFEFWKFEEKEFDMLLEQTADNTSETDKDNAVLYDNERYCQQAVCKTGSRGRVKGGLNAKVNGRDMGRTTAQLDAMVRKQDVRPVFCFPGIILC